eukprot:615230_1
MYYRYCMNSDLFTCTAGSWYYNGGREWLADTEATISACTATPTALPTATPTLKPSDHPTAPTTQPSCSYGQFEYDTTNTCAFNCEYDGTFYKEISSLSFNFIAQQCDSVG